MAFAPRSQPNLAHGLLLTFGTPLRKCSRLDVSLNSFDQGTEQHMCAFWPP